MVVVLTLASALSPTGTSTSPAREALDFTRAGPGGLPTRATALAEAGFGETRLGVATLTDGRDTGPAPAIVRMDPRARHAAG